MPTVDRLNLGASAEIAVRDWLTVKSGRPEMARQGLENIENAPGNGMASEPRTHKIQYKGDCLAAPARAVKVTF